MIQGCREYGVQEPEFIDMRDAFEAPAKISIDRVNQIPVFKTGFLQKSL